MSMVYRFSTILLLFGLLTACATRVDYQPAEPERDFGYSEAQIDEDQYRIEFYAQGDNLAQAVDYTMLRASELAMEQDYDWIAVIDQETRVNRREVGPRAMFAADMDPESLHACGLLGCRNYSRPLPPYQPDMHLGDELSDVSVSLTVRLGTGIRPTDVETFDAREIYADLSP